VGTGAPHSDLGALQQLGLFFWGLTLSLQTSCSQLFWLVFSVGTNPLLTLPQKGGAHVMN